jgi:hypothetical protein
LALWVANHMVRRFQASEYGRSPPAAAAEKRDSPGH